MVHQSQMGRKSISSWPFRLPRVEPQLPPPSRPVRATVAQCGDVQMENDVCSGMLCNAKIMNRDLRPCWVALVLWPFFPFCAAGSRPSPRSTAGCSWRGGRTFAVPPSAALPSVPGCVARQHHRRNPAVSGIAPGASSTCRRPPAVRRASAPLVGFCGADPVSLSPVLTVPLMLWPFVAATRLLLANGPRMVVYCEDL